MAEFFDPRRGGLPPERPFENRSGENPFSDASDAGQETSPSNPFSPPQAAIQPYIPGDYETQSPHRAQQVFGFGIVGLGAATLGLLAALISVFGSRDVAWALFVCLPLQLVSLAVSLPAWVMGHADCKAMSANAMDRGGQATTQLGLRLGQVAVVLSLLPVTLLVLFVLLGVVWV